MADSPSLVHLGESIRYHRQKKGWTQLKLEQESNLEKGTISNLEIAKGNPTYLSLLCICEALEITLRQLLEYEKPQASTG